MVAAAATTRAKPGHRGARRPAPFREKMEQFDVEAIVRGSGRCQLFACVAQFGGQASARHGGRRVGGVVQARWCRRSHSSFFERSAQFSQHLKDYGDDAGKRLMTPSSDHSICSQQRLVWTWWPDPPQARRTASSSDWTSRYRTGQGNLMADLAALARRIRACRLCVEVPRSRAAPARAASGVAGVFDRKAARCKPGARHPGASQRIAIQRCLGGPAAAMDGRLAGGLL